MGIFASENRSVHSLIKSGHVRNRILKIIKYATSNNGPTMVYYIFLSICKKLRTRSDVKAASSSFIQYFPRNIFDQRGT